jgi:hypothetical protein
VAVDARACFLGWSRSDCWKVAATHFTGVHTMPTFLPQVVILHSVLQAHLSKVISARTVVTDVTAMLTSSAHFEHYAVSAIESKKIKLSIIA